MSLPKLPRFCSFPRRQSASFYGAMRHKTAYELSASQVTTPQPIVELFWKQARTHRPRPLYRVLDLGAGDGRFAINAPCEEYVGVEIDRRAEDNASLPANATISTGCAFRHAPTGYDACIGNPPYVRHHDIEQQWKGRAVDRIERELGVTLDRHCNLYLYFLCLALMKTAPDGLVALIIPYEWVSRPSASNLRSHIRQRAWEVSVYRLQGNIFPGVLTTSSISVIDKSKTSGHWRFYDIDPEKPRPRLRAGPTASGREVLEYAKALKARTLRGLSPGSQKVFTLTESERIRVGLARTDVRPCVTSLRGLSNKVKVLTSQAFEHHFVLAGRRCWLIKSYLPRRSDALNAYLTSVPASKRSTYTCRHQTPWFRFRPHPSPKLLVASGFTAVGPKVLINGVRAIAVGSVWGVHSREPLALRSLQKYLLSFDFVSHIVGHARHLKKVEVRQLNAVLNDYAKTRVARNRSTR